MSTISAHLQPSTPDTALKIETFDNTKGGQAFFKAIGHPFVLSKIDELLNKLRGKPSVAVFDPDGFMNSFAAIHTIEGINVTHTFGRSYESLSQSILGHLPQPITALERAKVSALLIASFDTPRLLSQIKHLIPQGTEIITFDDIRLPNDMLSVRKQYLNPLNFATNFAFFRDQGGLHTRLTTGNYWTVYNGGHPTTFWMTLMNAGGKTLATWKETFAQPGQTITIDSQDVKRKFKLDDFTGQLFIHAIGAAGHDIVKYALDIYGDRPQDLSCTHDANSWPADLYAGLPAPNKDEKVILWVQNSHPCPIPANGVGLSVMGSPEISWYEKEIPPFASVALDTSDLLPQATWPQQLEIHAGKYFVRPRYEVVNQAMNRRMAHANVERTDLKEDPEIKKLEPLFGKGFILPAPILPRQRWRTTLLPTPMSTNQKDLPLALLLYDQAGSLIERKFLGKLGRADSKAIEIEELLDDHDVDCGHMELTYDFAEGGYSDGWLHGLFRYTDKHNGHVAESSFGAHIFNTTLTYKSEPQSYTGVPPGLSTRLFLRLGFNGQDALCHLIYPASTPWHAQSQTQLILHNSQGQHVATREISIPCSGSYYWTLKGMFDAATIKDGGENGYVIIRDTTCRLFGYHGLLDGDDAFCLDHMFGF